MSKFLKEIEEQPNALSDTWDYYDEKEGEDALNTVTGLWNSGDYDKIIFTGMGSSWFISQAASSMLSARGIPALAINAGELLHCQYPIINKKCLLVCISQSGESYEIVHLLKKVEQDVKIIAICNDEQSSLVRMAGYVLPCKAGCEEMTSTKTFVSCYLVAYLLVKALADELVLDVEEVIGAIGNMILTCPKWLPIAIDVLNSSSSILLIGRGSAFAAACQGALMFMEAAKTPALAIRGDEFRHGPLEMVKKGFVAIVFSHSQSGTYKQSLTLIKDILKYGGKVIFITDRFSDIENSRLYEFGCSCGRDELFVIQSIIPVQLMVNAWAVSKGIVPGEFTHALKVTNIE
ncbi:SIS domain-containing protein [Parabacteroides bouchesdurhonensis]|uniref:SIS domain-containing protein n=1 Tax=Parabacteroides bouchesdurhonensis TaxID=1936995 RepID=UPI000E538003|nr:SIS domain-containing protein [Parabacteroides bouchesdurhonensis]RHJ90246.1 SIS domain-containing protein [Bacteroides sp. AM07-16]